jgi:hypothetical protein
VFRCMSAKVWLCSYGANLVCDKADVSRVSKDGNAYCKQNPNSGFVPAYAVGHATIYEWKCVSTKARIVRPSAHVDQRGFIAENWERLGE